MHRDRFKQHSVFLSALCHILQSVLNRQHKLAGTFRHGSRPTQIYTIYTAFYNASTSRPLLLVLSPLTESKPRRIEATNRTQRKQSSHYVTLQSIQFHQSSPPSPFHPRIHQTLSERIGANRVSTVADGKNIQKCNAWEILRAQISVNKFQVVCSTSWSLQ